MKKYWYCFIPLTILFVFVFLIPSGKALFYSLTNYNILSPPVFTGLNNYTRMLQDPLFRISIVNFTIICIVSTLTGILISLIIYRGTCNFSNPAKTITGVLLASYSVFHFIPVALMYFFSKDAYGLVNSFLLRLSNTFTGLNFIQRPVNFSGDPVLARILAIILISESIIGPVYLLLITAQGSMSKKLIIAANSGILATLLVSFSQIPIFGLPSENYAVHTPLIHMYDHGFMRFEAGYMYSLMITTIIFTIILSGLLSTLFYFTGKIRLKENSYAFTKILSGFILALKALILFTLMTFSVSKIFQPIDERFLFPAKFFVRRPTLNNIIDFFESGLWKETLLALVIQTLFALIVFAVVAVPAGFAMSHSKNKSKLILVGIIFSVMFSILPLGMLLIDYYTALGILSASISPFLILSIFFVSTAFSRKKHISGILGGAFIVLFGSFTNAGIIGNADNPGLVNILIAPFGRNYFAPFLIFGIVLITAVLASVFIGVSSTARRDGSCGSTPN